MGYNQDLIVKWAPVLDSYKCQEDLKLTLATCCEIMRNDIYGIRKYNLSNKETIDFLAKCSIPILARVITKMNAFRIVDRIVMRGPTDKVNGTLITAYTKKICDYVPICKDVMRGKFASDYDINELTNLICNKLDAFIVDMLKLELYKESTSINRFDIMDIEPGEYHTAIISPGIKKWAFKHNGGKKIRNDQMQALCPSDYINDGKTELLIDNTSTEEYVILGNVGHGSATYCPYEPVVPEVKVIDSEFVIELRSRFGMAFNEVGKHYKMYKIVD